MKLKKILLVIFSLALIFSVMLPTPLEAAKKTNNIKAVSKASGGKITKKENSKSKKHKQKKKKKLKAGKLKSIKSNNKNSNPNLNPNQKESIYSSESNNQKNIIKELQENTKSGNEVYDFENKKQEKKLIKETENYPSTFDLRSCDLNNDGIKENYVTSVKLQNPFGTCWGFSAISAAETSILSSGLAPMDTDYRGIPTLNLSEKHLAYFLNTPIDDVESSQYGEGRYFLPNFTTQDKYDLGGFPFSATSLFSSGIGPNIENRNYPASTGIVGTMEDVLGYHGIAKNIDRAKIKNEDGTYEWIDLNYSENDNWDIDSAYRFYQSYILKDSKCMPSTADFDENGNYSLNKAAVAAYKKELIEGRAITMGFHADTSSPNQESEGKYISRNWAHYTYENVEANHAVTIIGWDDDYPKENFVKGHEPPGDGAWIVKNSWGSDEEEFPNSGSSHWGVVKTDEDGNPLKDDKGNEIHTGYFYISYYDQTVNMPESYEFDRSNVGKMYYLDQYDMLPLDMVNSSTSEPEVKMANVFYIDESVELGQVSCQTTEPGTHVTYNIYLLPSDFKSPDDGVLVDTIEKDYDFGGYHKETIKTPIKLFPRQYYSVEVIQKTDKAYTMNLQSGNNQKAMEDFGGSAYMNAVINEKESYLSLDGMYTDLSVKELQEDLLGDDYEYLTIDNFPIKAFLSPGDDTHVLSDLSISVSGNKDITISDEEKDNYVRVRLQGTSAVPESEVKWEVSDKDILQIKPDKNNDTRCNLIGKKAGLTYVTATLDGVGTYVCKVLVCSPAGKVYSIKTGERKSEELKVYFSDQSKYGISGYQIAYRPQDSDNSHDWKYKNVNKDQKMCILRNLLAGKKYEVQVRSYKTNKYGNIDGNWSDVEISPVVR